MARLDPSSSIALCMIVKNEEELLPGCLASAKGVWDELVVVDTGSTDATVQIATDAGARLIRRKWRDDFAEARNAGLEVAEAAWILVLDADERLSPELVEQIRATARDEKAGAATVVMVNALPHGAQRSARLLRLFRAAPTVRFAHQIHEDVTATVAQLLKRSGRALRHLDGTIAHLGYAAELATVRGKRERDVRLLKRCLARHPDDLYAHFKLLEVARFWHDTTLSAKAARSATRALERANRFVLRGLHFGGEMIALLAEALHADRPTAALELVERWFDRVSSSPALLLKRGQLRELTGHVSGATADYQKCLEMSLTDAFGAEGIRPRMGLTRLAIVAGNLPEARQRVSEALASAPRDPEALLASVSLASDLPAFEADYRRRFGAASELSFAIGDYALLTGQTELAVSHLRRVASTDVPGQLRLAQALLANGEISNSREVIARIQVKLPAAGVGLLVCDLIEGVDSDFELDLGKHEADKALRSWIDVLRIHRSRALLGQFRSRIPAIHELFPWLSGYVDRGGTPAEAR